MLEICKAYPEQVANAIEQHNKESAPSTSSNSAMDAIVELAKKWCDDDLPPDGRFYVMKFANWVAQQQHQ